MNIRIVIAVTCLVMLSAWWGHAVSQIDKGLILTQKKPMEIAKPMILKRGDPGEYILVMPEAVKAAIGTFDPTFVQWKEADFLPTLRNSYPYSGRQAPFAVVGDFNGDGRTDVVVQGHDKKSDVVLAALSNPPGFNVVELERGGTISDPKKEAYGAGGGKPDEYGLATYMMLEPKGKVETGFEEKPIKLKTDACAIIYFEKASVLYYFVNGAFKKYVTGD